MTKKYSSQVSYGLLTVIFIVFFSPLILNLINSGINEIKEITNSSNIIYSLEPSFDQIEIKYGKFEEMIISPKDKFEFAKYLTSLNPIIKNNITEK